MGKKIPMTYGAQGVFFVSMGSFLPHDVRRGIQRCLFVNNSLVYKQINTIFGGLIAAFFIDKVMKFRACALKIDRVMMF